VRDASASIESPVFQHESSRAHAIPEAARQGGVEAWVAMIDEQPAAGS